MSKLNSFRDWLLSLSKNKKSTDDSGHVSKKVSKKTSTRDVRTWYADRYNSILIQRNFMVIVTVVSIAAVIISVLVVAQITSQKEIEPFVIQVEDRSGLTKVIRPLNKRYLNSNEAMNRYFVAKYIQARESYFFPIHDTNRAIVRLYSASPVYKKYLWTVNPNNETSPVRWAEQGQREIKIVSLLSKETSVGYSGSTYQVRFIVTDTLPNQVLSAVKVATLRFDYIDMKLTAAERYTNPVGFQVMDYQVTDEIIEED